MIVWVLARLGLLLAAAVGLLWPLATGVTTSESTQPSTDPVTITDLATTMTLDAEGLLSATEDITAEFPPGRHGIFRYWDVADAADPNVRYQPDIEAITLDGTPVPYELSWESGRRFVVAKIGDPNAYVTPGSHKYTITYTVPGAISPLEAGAADTFASTDGTQAADARSAFLWTVVARGWEMPIDKATVTMALPGAAGSVGCSAGTTGGTKPCTITGAGTDRVTVSATDLPPRSGMVVRATLPVEAADQVTLPWPVAWDPILGDSLPAVLFIGAASVEALAIGWAWGRVAREQRPGFPVMYVPPDGLGPVQTVFMHTESTGPAALVATLMNLADQGYVKLEGKEGSNDWTVTSLVPAEKWESADPVGYGVASRLGIIDGPPFRAAKSAAAGRVLQDAQNAIGPDALKWGRDTGLVRLAPGEWWGRALWVLALGLAVLGFSLLIGPTMLGLPWAAFVIGGVTLMAVGVGQRRTMEGREVWSRAGGFQRLLGTPSAEDRFDFAARKDLFIHYVPYAVAFGVADRWAEKYRTATGAEPPIPIWFPMYYGTPAGFYSATGPDTFSSAVSTSIGAYTATQTPSGGGGGMGGFGGGGGGGGGSW